MIKSMTGYGRAKHEVDGREYTVEIKTVNHRYNDTSIRMPRYLNFLEDELRKQISQNISRGKIDVFVSLVNLSDKGKTLKLDKELARMYIDVLKQLVDEFNIKDDITATSIGKIPDVVIADDECDEDLFKIELKKATEMTILNLNNAREKEGEKLKQDILKRLAEIENKVNDVEIKSAGLLEEYKTKLENRVKELGATDIVDESRLGVEVVLFADKSSICEEVTRLRSHIVSLRNMLEVSEPIGKKLDFLVQEMNREVNTIGSKANSVGITNYVVDMKNEIENIREQIQNIE